MKRYTLANLRKALENPKLIRKEFDRLSESFISHVSYQLFTAKHGDGIDIMERDWDNLIILDACRYDYFAIQNDIEGELESVISKGSKSWPFMQGNFVDRQLHDTVYVTANPHSEKLDENVFYAMESALNKWDNELNTVLPGDVVGDAIDANNKYQNKRLIIHFMQPHKPFLGCTAKELRERYEIWGWGLHLNNEEIKSYKKNKKSVFELARSGEISKQQVQQAYSETLDIVLDHTEQLLEELDGKTVITSDHGNLLGERLFPFTKQRYGHPFRYTPILCVVPWLIIEDNNRRKIVEDSPINTDRADEEVIEERLEAFGYK